MNYEEFLVHLKTVIARDYVSQSAFARHNNLCGTYVNDVLKGRRGPGKRLLEAIGFEKRVIYQKVETVHK